VIDLEVVMSLATGYYREAKGYGSGDGPCRMPSDQIRALARALVEAVNDEFERRDDLDREIRLRNE
jgi:ferredoxin-thioredoxin reductase catalytic subunit